MNTLVASERIHRIILENAGEFKKKRAKKTLETIKAAMFVTSDQYKDF